MGVITSIGKNISEFKESLENGRLGISKIEGLDKFGELPLIKSSLTKDTATNVDHRAGNGCRQRTPQ